MLKKLLISFLFFTAYTVVLAHSIIPHNDENETSIEHHHDKDHNDDSDDNGLGMLFSHFQHIGTGNQFISTHQVALGKQIDLRQSAILFSSLYNLIFCGTEEPVPILFPDHPSVYSSSDKTSFALRGPPSITV